MPDAELSSLLDQFQSRLSNQSSVSNNQHTDDSIVSLLDRFKAKMNPERLAAWGTIKPPVPAPMLSPPSAGRDDAIPPDAVGPPNIVSEAEKQLGPVESEDFIANLAANAVQGAATGAAAIPKGISWAASQIDRIMGKDKDLKDYALYQLGDKIQSLSREAAPTDPRQAGELPGQIASGMAQAPILLAAGATGGLPAMIMMGAAQSGVASYDEAKAAGADENTAKDVSTFSALLGGVTMPLPYYRILGRLNSASGGALSTAMKGGFEAGVGGVIQRLGENKIAQIYDKERDLLEGVGNAGAASSIVGALSGGLLQAGRQLISKPLVEVPRETGKTGELEVAGSFKMTPEEAAKLGLTDAVFDDATRGKLAELGENVTKKQFAAAIGKKLADVKDFTRSNIRTIVGRAKQPVEVAVTASDVPFESSTKPQFGKAAGIVQLDVIGETMKQGWSAIKALAKKNLVVGGDLPVAVTKLDQTRQRNIGEIVAKAGFSARDFEGAMKKAYGDLATDPATRAKVDEALKTPNGIDTLPPDLQEPARVLRDHVDVLSQRLIDEGVIDGDLVATVDQNKGVYLNRSYKVFDDPKWAENVDPVVRNKFKSWLRSENPNDTDAQLEQKINELLYEGKAAQGPIAFLSRSKLGSKDLSILKARTLDDFPELRALYGEYKDPVTNYAKSVVRMANLLENHKFLTEVRTAGLEGRFLFDPNDPNIDPDASVRIAADASDAMHPLNGLRTFPEIEKAFRDAVNRQPEDRTWVRWLVKANILAKMANTVYSHQTQARNILGNGPMMAANGYWRSGKASDAFGAVMADLGISNNAAKRQGVLDGIKYGVLRQSVQAGDLNEMLRGLKKSDMDLAEAFGGPTAKLGKKVQSTALKVYGLGDDGPRYYGWLNERADYAKAHPEWSQEQLLQYTANIVNNVMPNYEALPPIIRKLRNFPGGNSFVSFPASMVKASYGIIRQSFKELADPATRGIGAKRLASFIATKAAPAGISLATAAFLGIDRKDDEALRESLPPWDENGELVWLQKPSAENKWTGAYTNLSSIDPFGMFDRAIIAGMRGGSVASGFAAGVTELLKNFVGEQMPVEKIMDVARNKRGDNAQPVYNEEDDGMQIFESILKHFGDIFVPGSAKSANRIVKAYKGEESPTGQVYDPTTETIAQFGIRASKFNLKTSLYYDAKEFARRTADAESIAASKILSSGPVPDEVLAGAQERSDRNRRAMFDKFHQQIVGLRKLGMPDEEIVKTLRFAGLSQREAAAVFTGTYLPYMPSQQGVKNTAKKLSIVNPKGLERLEDRLTAPQ